MDALLSAILSETNENVGGRDREAFSQRAKPNSARTFGAIVAAFAVGYIAHNDFGISLQEIRVLAAIGMSTIAALLAIEFFGRKLRKSKR